MHQFCCVLHCRKLNYRPLIRGAAHSGTLLSDGFKGQTNGFHEHLINSHPKLKQQISIWLTTGFKVQSLRLKDLNRERINKTPSTGRLRKFNDRKSANELNRIKMNASFADQPGHSDGHVNETLKMQNICDLKILPSSSTNTMSKYS